mmetsp:Transcript_13431/g.16916  ORF Transcript_13431/g.16916 Transcript_13431/m.16916 type:complete len:144 (+) Transcript_13431:734-1165(+)
MNALTMINIRERLEYSSISFHLYRNATKLNKSTRMRSPKWMKIENMNSSKLGVLRPGGPRNTQVFLDNDTKYEITFTLRYHSGEALAAKDPKNNIEPASGEWSIRLYSVGEGFTDEWNQDVVDDIQTMYYELMGIFGRPGYCD